LGISESVGIGMGGLGMRSFGKMAIDGKENYEMPSFIYGTEIHTPFLNE
jgi:hypothetical protein